MDFDCFKPLQGRRRSATQAAILAVAALLTSGCGPKVQSENVPKPMFDGADAATRAGLLAHGERLTHVLGCTGCHGAQLDGAQFEPEKKQYGPLYASNLTVALRQFSDDQVDAILRRGIHPTRKTVWVMPSEIFQHLSNADTAALIAYLRSLKPIGKALPPPRFSSADRQEIASGKFKPADQRAIETKAELPLETGSRYELGRYITEVTCAECHGAKLEGKPGRTPDLIVAGGYSPAEFDRLMTQGIPTGNRKLKPMMAFAAMYRFSHLTPHERAALYWYLKARAEQPSQ
jgi:mono/diheme cytochrome c family protein